MLPRVIKRFLQSPKDCRYLVCYMPRPARVKSPIRDLRAIIGKTQREFALSIGISPIALNRIENGTLALSARVLNKIVTETGVDPRSITGRARTLRTFREGKEYVPGYHKQWHESQLGPDKQTAAIRQAQKTSILVDILFRASVFGCRTKLWNVWSEIYACLDRCRVEFNLEQPIDEIFKKEHPGAKWIPVSPPDRIFQTKKATAKRKPRSSSVRRRKA